jgi:hypothetical protein
VADEPGCGRRPAKFAYLVLTHKEPRHVEELAARILKLSPGAEVAVHHDIRSHGVPWEGHPGPHRHLVERGPVDWGDWSMVEATLRLLRFGVEGLGADWLVLLSGEHRPVVDLEEWELETARSGVDALAHAIELPPRLRFGGGQGDPQTYLARSRHRWRLAARPRSDLLHRAVGGFAKMSRPLQPLGAIEYVHRRQAWAFGLRRSAGPMRGQSFFRGTQWIAVNRRAAETVIDPDPALTDWFRRSWIPDEAYFHTALRRQPHLVVANAPTTFVLETPERPTPGWMRLSMADLPAVRSASVPFARKVDPVGRPEIVSAIDQAVDAQRAARRARSPQPLS